MTENEERGTLNIGEIHPSAHIAHKYLIKHFLYHNAFTLLEVLSSSALSGDRFAEICAETLRRYLNKEPVSDRYLMGLAWMLYDMDEAMTLNEELEKKN